VIATGVQYSVRDFVNIAATELGIRLHWQGDGVKECGIVDHPGPHHGLACGQVIVRIDPRYFRPTEVEILLGDASKAHRNMGWKPSISFNELVKEMVHADLDATRKYALVRSNGFAAYTHNE